MKYHNVAPIEMLEAYCRGELSVSDSMWIEQLIQTNPMVKAVVENGSSINVGAVKSISSKTSKSISRLYLAKVGFWSKYGVWIGLSSIVLILGLALFFQKNNSAVYEQTAMTKELKSPKKVPSTDKFAAVVPIADNDKENNEAIESNKEDVYEILIENNNSKTEHLVIKKQESDLNLKTKIKPIEIENEPNSDNTRGFVTNANSSENQSVVLAVQNVQILAKSNPNDTKRSNNSKSDSPLSTFGGKSEKGSSYSMDDVPKFTGGDRALQNYFVGKLRPLKIKKGEDHYDRSVMIDLEINSRGKLKDYKVYGNLHPTHQKALIEAIKNLPKFSKGSENVVYSIGISF